MKIWLIELTSLCKTTKFLYKMTKLYKAAGLLCKVTELYNTTNDKAFGAKLWQSCVDETLYAPKF